MAGPNSSPRTEGIHRLQAMHSSAAGPGAGWGAAFAFSALEKKMLLTCVCLHTTFFTTQEQNACPAALACLPAQAAPGEVTQEPKLQNW